ncbi:MAG: hypothetical protein GY822_22945 [Deltaproteobacteria bacterium]|nr:hypothetical protein [Deltaproteobacteria bacterium]
MKHWLLFSFCFAMGCDPATSPKERCLALKSHAQLLLSELLQAEREYHLDTGTFTSNFALLKWAPRGETSLSFRIPNATKDELELSASELKSPDGWAADAWSLDDKGGFLHRTNGCLTGAQREKQQAVASQYMKKERAVFRFLSDGFQKDLNGAWVIELDKKDFLTSSKCSSQEKPMQVVDEKPKLLRAFNDVGAGHLLTSIQKNTSASVASSSKASKKETLFCEGQRGRSHYFRMVDVAQQTETWLVFPPL